MQIKYFEFDAAHIQYKANYAQVLVPAHNRTIMIRGFAQDQETHRPRFVNFPDLIFEIGFIQNHVSRVFIFSGIWLSVVKDGVCYLPKNISHVKYQPICLGTAIKEQPSASKLVLNTINLFWQTSFTYLRRSASIEAAKREQLSRISLRHYKEVDEPTWPE